MVRNLELSRPQRFAFELRARGQECPRYTLPELHSADWILALSGRIPTDCGFAVAKR